MVTMVVPSRQPGEKHNVFPYFCPGFPTHQLIKVVLRCVKCTTYEKAFEGHKSGCSLLTSTVLKRKGSPILGESHRKAGLHSLRHAGYVGLLVDRCAKLWPEKSRLFMECIVEISWDICGILGCVYIYILYGYNKDPPEFQQEMMTNSWI